MKQILLAGAVVILAACGSGKTEKIEKKVEIKAYGPVEVNPDEAISVQEMLTEFNKTKEEQEFTFEGKITEVCTNAGCWVNIDKGNGETFMVRFKDHFTIPIDTKLGSMAFLHGIAYMDTIPVEDLQHYAEDAGKSEEEIAKITEPKYELNFEADGILFRKEETKKTVN